ncbi:MAG TPA: efflux RND transporter periplasmic adaptor subunit [Burkholderiaceae bacterium]|jgi:multidrug efflux system membrane fusion protein|nr:efflux RND transporter periplasmic adaptor subunit [Burkholderiaceae bacterium]
MTSPFQDSRARWGILAGGLFAAALAGWLALRPVHAADDAKKPGAKRPDAPVQVTTAAARTQDVSIYRTGIGTVTAAQSVTVRTRIDGQLDKVEFNEGQDVKAGQRLARIDPRTYEAQVLQAQAQRAKDEAQLGNARVDLQRYTTLIAQDATTQQQLDTQKALVAQLDATVKTDDAAIRVAQVQLSYTDIAAPIGGRTGARLVDQGNVVHAADTNGLVVINQIDPIAVVFTLPEDVVEAVNQASGGPLVVDAFPREGNERLATGKLTLLNNQIDTTSGTVQMKGMFPNAQHKLWPGQYVSVRLVLGTRKGAITVPAQAVQRSPDGMYLYVVQPDGRTVKNVPVEVATTQDGIAVIAKGLAAGQRVVTDGQFKLKPGSAISEAPRGASAPAGAQSTPAEAGATQ